ncbi:3640_t:CDS:1 [Gigaspora rosea]|nr:3640_t:CDS:1 [Gigaspora rosea]
MNITNSNEENHLVSENVNENKTFNSLDESDETRKRKVLIVAENPTLKRRKGRQPKAHRILSSIENNKNNQQVKQRSIKCTYCHEIGHNIRCCKARLADKANEN